MRVPRDDPLAAAVALRPRTILVPLNAKDMNGRLSGLGGALGQELTAAGTADGLRFAGLLLCRDASGARWLKREFTAVGLDGVASAPVSVVSGHMHDSASAT